MLERPEHSVGEVIRRHGDRFLDRYGPRLSSVQRRALKALLACRTSLAGGHTERCEDCGTVHHAYNSCRNRSCPKCLLPRSAKWLTDRRSELVNAPYFHVGFTLPQSIAALGLANQRRVYGLLFEAAAKTLKVIGKDPKHLGARVGGLMVLHTWSQTLEHHPHVHCVVPGGGLSKMGAAGFDAAEDFSSRFECSPPHFGDNFWTGSLAFGGTCASEARRRRSRRTRRSTRGSRAFEGDRGWCTRSRRSARRCAF